MRMEMRAFWNSFRRGLWWIVLVTFMAAATAGIVSRLFVPDTYQSTATLMVMAPGPGTNVPSSMLNGQQLVDTYITMVDSHTVLQQVATMTGYTTADRLKKIVTVASVPNTDVLTVTATSHSATRAATIANLIASQSIQQIDHLTSSPSLKVAVNATPPTHVHSPNVLLDTLLGGFVGAFLSIILLVVVYVLDERFQSPQEIASHLGVPLLANIPPIRPDLLWPPTTKRSLFNRQGTRPHSTTVIRRVHANGTDQ